jgi:hypothetical protein
LFHRLHQDSFGLVHRRTRSSPFPISGAPRSRLRDSRCVLFNALSDSATRSKPGPNARTPACCAST